MYIPFKIIYLVSDAEAMSTEYFIFNPGSQSYVPFVPDASEDQFQGISVLHIQSLFSYLCPICALYLGGSILR